MHTPPASGRVAHPPPIEMQRARRWLLWTSEPRQRPDGTTVLAKVPRYIDGAKRRGDLLGPDDAARLVDYPQAVAAMSLYGNGHRLGFALGADSGGAGVWQGIDFDHVDQRPELAALVSSLPGYVETSPSGTGVHAIGYGAPFGALGSNRSGIEAYSAGRFFTVTGWAVRAGPVAPLEAYVARILAPRHAAGRRVDARAPRGPVAPTGDRVLDELRDALRYVDADDRDAWVGVGQALYPLGDVGRELWAEWSATSERFPGGDDLDRWDSFKGERTGYAAIFNRATSAGWKNPRKLDAAAIFAGSPLVATRLPEAPNQTVPAPPIDPHAVNGHAHVPDVATPSAAPAVPPVPAAPLVPAARLDGQAFRGEGGAQRAATLENVVDAIGPESGMRIAFDEFQDVIMIGTAAGEWRMLTDNDYATLRATLGRGGFKPVAAEIMRSAVALVAEQRKFDSARQWCESLVWDGVPRVAGAMSRYFGAEDNPYTRAVGLYLFTALAGRALVHPLQADMAVILVGLQGARKTTAVAALAPVPRAFGEVDLGKRDDDLARRLRGKLVVEWSEMRGMAGRDLEGIKAWLSRRVEEWTPKYKEFATYFDRRCIVVGTANTTELLDDDTGERRMLPLMAGETDPEALAADRAQLWAEGVALFRAGGVAWQQAEALARGEHAHFKIGDPWQDFVLDWLAALPTPKLGEIPSPHSNGSRPFALHAVALEALQIRRGEISRTEEKRIAKILRSLGYEKAQFWTNGTARKLWQRVVTPTYPMPSPSESVRDSRA